MMNRHRSSITHNDRSVKWGWGRRCKNTRVVSHVGARAGVHDPVAPGVLARWRHSVKRRHESDWRLLHGGDGGRERRSYECRLAHVARPGPEKTQHRWVGKYYVLPAHPCSYAPLKFEPLILDPYYFQTLKLDSFYI
jgi:hypothetical protein